MGVPWVRDISRFRVKGTSATTEVDDVITVGDLPGLVNLQAIIGGLRNLGMGIAHGPELCLLN